MDVVTIQTRHFGITQNIKRDLPVCWKDVNSHHLITLAKFHAGIIDDRQFFIELLKLERISGKFTSLDAYMISKQAGFLNSLEPVDYFIIPEIKIGKCVLKSPKKRFKDTTFGQFVMFDSIFMDHEAGDHSVASKFIANLYDPGKFSIDEAVELIDKLPDYKKLAVIINYRMLREWLGKIYTYLFMKDETDEKKPKKQGKNNNWLPVLDSLISKDLANAEKYEQLPMHTVLRRLNMNIKNYYRGKVH
jgi:hypothetical protein